MLKFSDIGLREQIFTHLYEGVVTMLAVERMGKSPEFLKLELFMTPVEAHFAKWAMDNRGIEPHRLERITRKYLDDHPLTYCIFPKPASLGGGISHMLVDGNHRYVKAAMLGMSEMLARVAPESLWRKFQVADIPVEAAEFLLENQSGIP